MSMRMGRLIRRPPESFIPRQLRQASVINFDAGMLTTVLSKFCTFTVVNDTSITSPSMPWPFISIQSPLRTVSLVAI